MEFLKRWIREQSKKWIQEQKGRETSIIGNIFNYILKKGILRSAQVEALEVYFWLKLEKKNKSVYNLVLEDFENGVEGFIEKLSEEYSNPTLKSSITPQDIALLLNSKEYTDYVFSLPMGAGKTFLMASIIYIEVYLANLIHNSSLGRNFLIFAPSGLKSSVIPSLRSIENFDPQWVLPADEARRVKRLLKFEVLDKPKSKNKSNLVKNPNAQKVNRYLSEPNLQGLVMVTNAEKVIMNKVSDQFGEALIENSKDVESMISNELRHTLSLVPNLVIMVDEVHHTQKEENKLLNSIAQINSKGNVSTVMGFTGTPYHKHSLKITTGATLKLVDITNTVYHFSITKAVGTFLKRPVISKRSESSEGIIREGLENFYSLLWNHKYSDGRLPKIAIYSPSVKKLKYFTRPLVEDFLNVHGLSSDCILEYFSDNKEGSAGTEAEREFLRLDRSNKIRIVLLCQIGKEGWDCPSLASVVLSQEGDSTRNSTLQSATRCLREVVDAQEESGYIYLNEKNYRFLEEELKSVHNISVKEFEAGAQESKDYYVDRTQHLKLPPLVYNQLVVNFKHSYSERTTHDSTRALTHIFQQLVERDQRYFRARQSIDIVGLDLTDIESQDTSSGTPYQWDLSFLQWVQSLELTSFYGFSISDEIRSVLLQIYSALLAEHDRTLIEGDILRALLPQSTTKVHELVEVRSVQWVVNNLKERETRSGDAYPPKEEWSKIVRADEQGGEVRELSAEQEQVVQTQINSLKETMGALWTSDIEDNIRGQTKLSKALRAKEYTFHYLPYQFDSSKNPDKLNEFTFWNTAIEEQELKKRGLELYFNGDRAISTFKPIIYQQSADTWKKVQEYTPDFLIIKRSADRSTIEKVLIVETKGTPYAEKFKPVLSFMEDKFKELNPHYDYLYLEDSTTLENATSQLNHKIQQFFN